jgi:hypothetical protein
MKITAMTMLAVAAGMVVQGGAPSPEVTVYLRDNANAGLQVKALAMDSAAKIFATAGVQIVWRVGLPSRSASHPIVIDLRADEPVTERPGALGYARVYEGVHITVFYDRILHHGNATGVVLGHVMVHEIAHILQGVSRHSESGVMKAIWTTGDYREMYFRPLPFTPHDVMLIHQSLAAWENARIERDAAVLAAE